MEERKKMKRRINEIVKYYFILSAPFKRVSKKKRGLKIALFFVMFLI